MDCAMRTWRTANSYAGLKRCVIVDTKILCSFFYFCLTSVCRLHLSVRFSFYSFVLVFK